MPLLQLIWAAFNGGLGANPIEFLTFATGDWTLRMLLITLAVSPLQQRTGLAVLVRFRRMLGLFTFFYVCCHFLIWFVADHSMDVSGMFEDIIERPYITLGFSAFLLLIPLALTSNKLSVRRLGAARWTRLHRLVYLIAILAILHYIWLVKADYLEAGVYAFIAAALLLLRLPILRRYLSIGGKLRNANG